MTPDSPLIVHLLPSTDDAGAENQARYLLAGLKSEPRLRANVELAYFRRGRAHPAFEALGLPMHDLGCHAPLALDAPRRLYMLSKALAHRPPSILHTWLYEASVLGALAKFRWPSVRVVMAQRSGNIMRTDRGRMQVLRMLRRRIDGVIANSNEGLRFLVDLGYPEDMMSLTPHTVPAERIEVTCPPTTIRDELGIPRHARVVCAVGRPDGAKDLPGLMCAMAIVRESLPDVRLVLVGPTHDELTHLGAAPGELDHPLGWLSRPADVMAAADVIAMASWTEGHSNVIDEALMLGLPVACTDTGDHPQLVARAGGLTVPVRQPDQLAQAILSLLVNPPSREYIRAVAHRELSLQGVLNAHIAVYERMLGGSLSVGHERNARGLVDELAVPHLADEQRP